jgi:hypothetical protein
MEHLGPQAWTAALLAAIAIYCLIFGLLRSQAP